MARNRAEFRTLAKIRVREARALLKAKLWDGAYYLAGYAVECGLKACVAKRTRRGSFPDKDFAQKCWTHDIKKLVELAGLGTARGAAAPPRSQAEQNWQLVQNWDEGQRYERKSQADAEALYAAVTDPADGVLTWIKQHW